MEEIGVQAVVKGLSSFLSDLGKIDQGLKGLAPSGNLLTAIFSGIGNAARSLGREILNVAEFMLGHLLADAIEFIIGKLRDLAVATFEAGSQFQTMQLRLERLNFNSALESGDSYSEAMRTATAMTRDQLNWVRKLAVTTPYDAQDIANVFTLARSYGFASESAKGLTQDISNFAAGMGLGNTEIERIIVNFGQMVQQGKVTQREMNDLARGAFVPVNDVLKRMQENVGLTDKEFDKFKTTGEGVNAWMTAFSQIVKERFAGAAEDMARTFQGAIANAVDFLKNLIGFNVVVPILDTIGGRIADIIAQLTDTEVPQFLDPEQFRLEKMEGPQFADPEAFRLEKMKPPDLSTWEKLDKAAQGLGKSISKVVDGIFGLLPSTDGLSDKIILALDTVTNWINEHRDDIIGFFTDVKDKALEIWDALKEGDFEGFLEALGLDDETIASIVEFKDSFLEQVNAVKDWIDENGPLISEFFTTLGEIIGTVFENLTGEEGGTANIDSLLEGVTAFMQYVIDNKDAIAEFLTKLTAFLTILQIVTFVWGILTTIVLAFLAPILGVVAAIAGLIGTVVFVIPILTALGVVLLVVAAALATGFILFMGLRAVIMGLSAVWAFFVTAIQTGVDMAVKSLGLFMDNINRTVREVRQAFISGDWVAIGAAIINGIIRGVKMNVTAFIETVKTVIKKAIDAAIAALGIGSPSKVFMEIGEQTMQGLALGIENLSGMVAMSMERAVMGVTMPAMSLPAQMQAAAAPSVSNSSVVNNMNLTVNSSARTEPIAADFNMMRSLIQG